jgi:hypothetical protein
MKSHNPWIQTFFTRVAMTALMLVLSAATGWAATSTVTFGTPGNYTWKCPAGINYITVQCWGGGGAGGGGIGGSGASRNEGGGGGGGAYASSTVSVTPGTSYSIVVGAGGISTSNAYTSVGDSSFASTVVVAKAGGNGQGFSSGNAQSGTGGNPGLASASTGTTKNDGGTGENGVAGSSNYGGAGGSSAGTGLPGATSTSSTGIHATPPAGAGAGGDGGQNGAAAGGNASNPGGGGGGANMATSARNGGSGGAGQVSITANVGPFAPGNIVVDQIGDGSASLSSTSAPVFLDEFTISGAPVQSIPMPQASTRPTSNPFHLMDSSASSDGQLTRSTNGAIIEIPGYNGIPTDAGVVSSNASAVSRTIGTVDNTGAVDTSRSLNMLSGNNFRSVISGDGSAFWAAGQPGIVYVSGGTVTSLCASNTRCLNISSGQLFYSTQSGINGIYVLGAGLPTSGTPPVNLVIDLTANGGNPEAFQFNLTANTCYIADSRSSKGGVFKYTYNGSGWVSNYLFSVSGGAFGLAVDWSGANPVIYATTADGKNLITITDTGSGTTPTTLATVDGSTKYFHGVAFAPKGSTSMALASSLNPSPLGSNVTFVATGSGGGATPTGTVQFKTNGIALGSAVTLSASGTATNSTALLPAGSTTIAAEYSGDSNYLPSTNTLAQVVIPPPVANPATYGRAYGIFPSPGISLKISITNLLSASTSDPANDTVSLLSVAGGLLASNTVIATTTNGSSVYIASNCDNSACIILTPTNNLDESFQYVINDASYPSLMATNLITVNVTNAVGPTITNLTFNGATAIMNLAGIPGSTVVLERSTNLTAGASWVPILTNTIGGAFTFTDMFPDIVSPPPSQAFYRMKQNN